MTLSLHHWDEADDSTGQPELSLSCTKEEQDSALKMVNSRENRPREAELIRGMEDSSDGSSHG